MAAARIEHGISQPANRLIPHPYRCRRKYNKKLGNIHGLAEENLGFEDSYAFVRSRERTEIETVARGYTKGRESAGDTSEQREEATRRFECPVCLDELHDPVAPACGHPMCRRCHAGMMSSRAVRRIRVAGGHLLLTPKNQSALNCPLCRAPAVKVERMPSLARAIRAARKCE